MRDSGAFRGFAADIPDCMVRNRLLDAASFGAGEEIYLWTLPSKILPQSFKEALERAETQFGIEE